MHQLYNPVNPRELAMLILQVKNQQLRRAQPITDKAESVRNDSDRQLITIKAPDVVQQI